MRHYGIINVVRGAQITEKTQGQSAPAGGGYGAGER